MIVDIRRESVSRNEPTSEGKIPVLAPILVGLCVLALLAVPQAAKPAIASQPTPTPGATRVIRPPAGLLDAPCRLEPGMDCDFIQESVAAAALSRSMLRTNPLVDARGVPTHTLISITFDRDMDSGTINRNTFSVSQGTLGLEGTIRYIAASKMAVFYPDEPLMPDTMYTARVTSGVRDLSGEHLAADVVWSFTTSSGISPLAAAGISSSRGSMNIYFGDLHSHSGYSDGQGTPADAFATARANGLDFFALTDHAFMLTAVEWQDMRNQAVAATIDGVFVGLRGFEFTHAKGHINVFETETFVDRDDPSYQSLEDFYAWLVVQPAAIAQFNHPEKNDVRDWNFNDFAYHAAADHKIVLRELSTPEQYFLSLDSGWHLGTLLNSDTHEADWGSRPRMGLIAPSLTRAAVLEALRARRTFFVPPFNPNFALVIQANGYWMGSAVPVTDTLHFTVTAHDPDPPGSVLRLALYDNGVQVAAMTLPPSVSYTWTPTISGVLGHYIYAEAHYPDWWYPAYAYSSPIWVERLPLAEAGPPQAVVPGASVTLDGSQSRDADGDVLAYQWTQEVGPPMGLSGADTARAGFTAPGTPVDLVFRLVVTDAGSLSDFDTTLVAVTDRPILSITKDGPASAEPGELITYTLTITNRGLTDASGVVVTDALPTGATYVAGGILMPGDIVSWTLPNLAANGGVAHVFSVVTATHSIANTDYGASCPGCVPAVGEVTVLTRLGRLYLPVISKGYR